MTLFITATYEGVSLPEDFSSNLVSATKSFLNTQSGRKDFIRKESSTDHPYIVSVTQNHSTANIFWLSETEAKTLIASFHNEGLTAELFSDHISPKEP